MNKSCILDIDCDFFSYLFDWCLAFFRGKTLIKAWNLDLLKPRTPFFSLPPHKPKSFPYLWIKL